MESGGNNVPKPYEGSTRTDRRNSMRSTVGTCSEGDYVCIPANDRSFCKIMSVLEGLGTERKFGLEIFKLLLAPVRLSMIASITDAGLAPQASCLVGDGSIFTRVKTEKIQRCCFASVGLEYVASRRRRQRFGTASDWYEVGQTQDSHCVWLVSALGDLC